MQPGQPAVPSLDQGPAWPAAFMIFCGAAGVGLLAYRSYGLEAP